MAFFDDDDPESFDEEDDLPDEEGEYYDDEGDADDGDADEEEPLEDDLQDQDDDFEDEDGEEDDAYPDDAEDYTPTAEEAFGDNEYFGETIDDQLADEGYQLFDDAAFTDAFERLAPGSSETVRLFEKDGQLHAFGFIPAALMAVLRQQYGGIDFGNLRASVPLKGELAEPKPLPPEYAAIKPEPKVDLRPYCSPVGDQGDTSRCSAFAWTHALEMTRVLDGLPGQRLSPTYTMLQFQRMQGDAEDYSHAYEGGSGTVSGTDPGEVIVNHGSCRQELWPDGAEEPKAPERQLAADAAQFRHDADPHPLFLDDIKHVLTAGSPVHVGMNTGPAFTTVGRDGMIPSAERASGRHGRHAMLIVGYNGNFYITKNSWGEQWGDRGYCYIPKDVLAASEPELIGLLRPLKK